jgi:2-desacetyl-2-hydroxyethyl bacteriochlorophyllide A dehydrogenase
MINTQAIWFPGPRQVELRNEIVQPPGPTEVQIQTSTSAISHGTEMLVYRGHVPATLPLDLPTCAGSYAFPIKFGYAAVGTVQAIGSAVSRCQIGDQVFALHPHQRLFNAPETLVTWLHAETPPEHGVFAANLETAISIVHDAAPRLGETVVVFGLGVVGLLVTQLLARMSLKLLLVVDPIEARRDLALALGADLALTPGEALVEWVRAACDGRGADLAIEVSGNPQALQPAIDCVATEGTVVVGSWYGTKPVTLELGSFFHRGRVRVRSAQVGQLAPELGPRWNHARRSRLVADLLTVLDLDPLISQRVPLAQAARAYQLIDEHPEQIVQIILTYDSALQRRGQESPLPWRAVPARRD